MYPAPGPLDAANALQLTAIAIGNTIIFVATSAATASMGVAWREISNAQPPADYLDGGESVLDILTQQAINNIPFAREVACGALTVAGIFILLDHVSTRDSVKIILINGENSPHPMNTAVAFSFLSTLLGKLENGDVYSSKDLIDSLRGMVLAGGMTLSTRVMHFVVPFVMDGISAGLGATRTGIVNAYRRCWRGAENPARPAADVGNNLVPLLPLHNPNTPS